MAAKFRPKLAYFQAAKIGGQLVTLKINMHDIRFMAATPNLHTEIGKADIHCGIVLQALRRDPPQSLQDYAAMDIGFTDFGVQVWCRRHKANIVHIDFQGP